MRWMETLSASIPDVGTEAIAGEVGGAAGVVEALIRVIGESAALHLIGLASLLSDVLRVAASFCVNWLT